MKDTLLSVIADCVVGPCTTVTPGTFHLYIRTSYIRAYVFARTFSETGKGERKPTRKKKVKRRRNTSTYKYQATDASTIRNKAEIIHARKGGLSM